MILPWTLVTKHLHPHDQLQAKIRQKIAKLEKHLQHFPPDTVHLLVHLERHPKRDDFTASLTLRLPSNILHSRKQGTDAIPVFDRAVKALLRELSTLKAELRREKSWKSRERREELRAETALRFADQPTPPGVAPQTLADTLAEMIRRYHGRLRYHVQRQLWRDHLAGAVPKGAIDADAVVDEAVRQALSAPERKPEDVSYRFWLYTLTKRELRRRYKQLRLQAQETVPLSESATLSEEASEAQGYDVERPFEIIEAKLEPPVAKLADLVADPSAPRPDAAAAESDLVHYLHRITAAWPAKDRAVFELHFLEGFEEDEVAMLEQLTLAEARALIQSVQTRLRHMLLEATDRLVAKKAVSAKAQR